MLCRRGYKLFFKRIVKNIKKNLINGAIALGAANRHATIAPKLKMQSL